MCQRLFDCPNGMPHAQRTASCAHPKQLKDNLPAASRSPSLCQRRAPFHTWFANTHHSVDVLLAFFELCFICSCTFTRSLAALGCPADAHYVTSVNLSANSRAAHVIKHFPCHAGSHGRLFYVLRTFSFFDPRIAFAMQDYAVGTYVAGLIACVVGPLLCCAPSTRGSNSPWARWRLPLLLSTRYLTQIGQLACTVVNPMPNLIVSGAAYFAANRGRPAILCHMWRALVTARVSHQPSSTQQ